MADPARADAPLVQLDWSLWCGRHLEPYRARWPEGAAPAMLALFQAAARMPAVVDAAGGQAGRLTQALRRFKPLCCFVSKPVLDEIYATTLPGREAAGG